MNNIEIIKKIKSIENIETNVKEQHSRIESVENELNQIHTHTNLDNLNKIGEDSEGNLTYNGKSIEGDIFINDDYYNKTEIDNRITSIAKGMNWKENVPTKTDLENLENNSKGDARIVDEESNIYVFNGEYWDKVGSSINIPNATSENDGLLSKEDYNKLNNLDNIYVQKDNNKTLSSNDYTNIDKNKVNTIITDGEGNRFLSDSGNYIEIGETHNHTNLDNLNKIGEDSEGNLTYNGKSIINNNGSSLDYSFKDYNINSTYDIEDYVLFNNSLYKCKTKITTPEKFDYNKWELVIGMKYKITDVGYSNLKYIDNNKIYIIEDTINDFINNNGYNSDDYNTISDFILEIINNDELLIKFINDYKIIFIYEDVMNEIFSNSITANKFINNQTIFNYVINSETARLALFNNYNITTNILQNSTEAINTMKNSNRYKRIVPTTNYGISENLQNETSINYSGKAFVFNVYTSSVNNYYTHWHGSYMTGTKDRYYVGLRHSSTSPLIVNEFASDIRSGTDYGSTVGCAEIFMI